MRNWFPVAIRTGRVQVPVAFFDTATDGETTRTDDLPEDEESTEYLIGRVGTRRTEHTFEKTDTGTYVTETVSNGGGWYGMVLAGMLLFLGGRIAALQRATGMEALGTALGLFALLAGTVVATPTGALTRRQVSLQSLQYPQLPLLGIVWAGCLLAVLVGGRLGIACGTLMLGTWLVHGYSRILEDSLTSVTVRLSDLIWRLPALPTRYVVTMTTANSALLVFTLANTQIELVHPTRLLAALALTTTVVLGALAMGQSGWRARAGVLVAAATTGLFLLSIPLYLDIVVQPLAIRSPSAVVAFCLAIVVCLAAWIVLWYGLFSSQTLTRARFLDSGREIGTAEAAVAAYLMITTAGAFLCATVGTGTVVLVLLPQDVHSVVWALGATLAVPAVYLAAGSLYQLGGLVAMVWTIRTRSDRGRSGAALSLPFEPDYPVWILDADDFYAGAYWDPLDRAIVVSRGAIATLDDHELAAIVAHEESHFEYRGAQLQFAFALLPAFALMGKNVVYSIYDFYERELTADAYALQRLDDAIDGDDAPDVLIGLLQKVRRDDLTPLEGSVLTFLPTLQTTAITQPVQRWIDRVFHTFYGHFAGEVHPSIDDRIRAVRAREEVIDDLAPTERPGDESG